MYLIAPTIAEKRGVSKLSDYSYSGSSVFTLHGLVFHPETKGVHPCHRSLPPWSGRCFMWPPEGIWVTAACLPWRTVEILCSQVIWLIEAYCCKTAIGDFWISFADFRSQKHRLKKKLCVGPQLAVSQYLPEAKISRLGAITITASKCAVLKCPGIKQTTFFQLNSPFYL